MRCDNELLFFSQLAGISVHGPFCCRCFILCRLVFITFYGTIINIVDDLHIVVNCCESMSVLCYY